MAYAAMTSDTIRRDGQEERRLAQEAREHAQKIPDNYRKLLFSEDDTEKVKEHYTNPSYITPHAPSANAAIERAPAPVQTARPAAQPQPCWPPPFCWARQSPAAVRRPTPTPPTLTAGAILIPSSPSPYTAGKTRI